MIAGRVLNKVINIFTGLFGIATIILMLVCYINSALGGFLPAHVIATIESGRNYSTLATVFCAGIEFTLKRNVVLAIVFACIVVAVAAFMLYTDLAI